MNFRKKIKKYNNKYRYSYTKLKRKYRNKEKKRKYIKKKYNNISKVFKLLLIIILSILLFILIYINKSQINKIKVCLCTLGKQENRYIKEYVEHYKKYGVDKIYLYDNNDVNGEKFEEVISDDINEGFVEILNWRGRKFQIYNIMNDCYRKNNANYDWLLFYELDEFIYLRNYTNIKSFLHQNKFKGCQLIYLNMICHTDNNKIYYENKSLAERFPERVPRTKYLGKNLEIKSIIRGNITNMKIENMHTITNKFINCNGYGNKNKNLIFFSTEPDFDYYYINHYYSKSTEEFINKINRGDAFSTSTEYIMQRIEKYFNQSIMTLEKIEMIEKGIKLDLSKFKKSLNNNI